MFRFYFDYVMSCPEKKKGVNKSDINNKTWLLFVSMNVDITRVSE